MTRAEIDISIIEKYLCDAKSGNATAAKVLFHLIPDQTLSGNGVHGRVVDTILFENYIRHANEGNVESAKLLLHLFVVQQRDGGDVHPLIMDYVAAALGGILAGNRNPSSALGLTRRACRPVVNYLRDIRIAAKVCRRMESGQRLNIAALEVGNECGLHESQVQNIYSKRKQDALAAIRAGMVVEESELREYDRKQRELV